MATYQGICPTCGAAHGAPCHSPAGNRLTKPHAARRGLRQQQPASPTGIWVSMPGEVQIYRAAEADPDRAPGEAIAWVFPGPNGQRVMYSDEIEAAGGWIGALPKAAE